MVASSRSNAPATTGTTSSGDVCTAHGGTPSSRMERGGTTPGAALASTAVATSMISAGVR